MNLKQAFVAAATVAVAGFGTSVALACDDRGLIDHQRPPIVQLADSQPGRSAESAASPADAGLPDPVIEVLANGAGSAGRSRSNLR
jgi:hypothetical protein